MYWVIQANIFSEPGFERLISALERLEIPHSVHKVVPGFHGDDPKLEPECNPPDGPVIVMGSYTMADIAKNRGWLPGSFVGPNLDMAIQSQHWGRENLLNADWEILELYEIPNSDWPRFVRPVKDSKAFSGKIIDHYEYCSWMKELYNGENYGPKELNAFTEVITASKKEIYNENRLWVVDRKIVTWSRYKIGTIKQYSSYVDMRVIEFAEGLIAKWVPLDCFVLDIADTPLGLRVVEVNCLNASGYYEADMNKLVMALEEYGNKTGVH